MKVKKIQKRSGKFIVNTIPIKSEKKINGISLKNENSIGMPDIDYDVGNNDIVTRHLMEVWGENNVVRGSNWNTLQTKSLIKDVSKNFGIPFSEINKLTSIMEKEASAGKKKKLGIKAGVVSIDFDDLEEFSDTYKNFIQEHKGIDEHFKVLRGQVRSCGRHAGSTIIADNLNEKMPLISNKGIIQTPWLEGQTVRHLEPLGFIKFDILGLETLEIFRYAIKLILQKYHNNPKPSFKDIREYYRLNLHPDTFDFDNVKIYEETFHKGNMCGIFQFAEPGIQKFAKDSRPTSLMDVTTITSIWRPGALGNGFHHLYKKIRNGEESPKYRNNFHKDVLEKTDSLLIFQEQIAELALTYGKDISLNEANMLRKVLTKKGTGKEAEVKERIRKKFFDGFEEKNLPKADAEYFWEMLMRNSQYSFNYSHALGYSMLSCQCAWFLTYYPDEWVCAYLQYTDEKAKEKAFKEVFKLGYKIEQIDINNSTNEWMPHPTKSKMLLQPLSTLKGVGEKASEKIQNNRPFHSFKEMVIGDKKLGKKELDCLIKIGSLDEFIFNENFSNRKHAWMTACEKRPTNQKKYQEYFLDYKDCEDFSREELISEHIRITGQYPVSMFIDDKMIRKMEELCIPPISEFDPNLQFCWFVVVKKTVRQTKFGKPFWVLEALDNFNKAVTIKVWGPKPEDDLEMNALYIARLNHDDYGFSIKQFWKNLKKVDTK